MVAHEGRTRLANGTTSYIKQSWTSGLSPSSEGTFKTLLVLTVVALAMSIGVWSRAHQMTLRHVGPQVHLTLSVMEKKNPGALFYRLHQFKSFQK